jgi:hypothetical protein
MNNTFSQFLAAYNQASQNIKNVIDSEEIGLFVDTLAVDPSLKSKFLVIISNRILDLIPDSELISQLEQIGFAEPEKIAQIKNFVTLKTTTTTANTISSEIAEAEAVLETLSPIRTMAGDSRHTPAPAESTYTSMQSAILGEGK